MNHEIVDPIVGKMYMVPVAEYYNQNWNKIVAVPVIGSVHADKDFSARSDKSHIHIDARFTTRLHDRIFNIGKDGKTNHVLWVDLIPDMIFSSKRMVCKRQDTCINPPSDYEKYNAWYRKNVGLSCKGRVCPHRGTIMHKYKDGFRCPLHGLKAGPGEFIVPNWNMEEGVAS